MAKTNITQYSSTPSSNTDINNINIDENCPASGLNNAIRELMAHLKNVDTGSQALTALSVTGDTIISSGNVGFGKSSYGSISTDGLWWESASDYLAISGTGTSPLYLNRNGSDGGIVNFYKSGTQVGAIQTFSDALQIGSYVGNDAFIQFVSSGIKPTNSAGTNRDNGIDLGASNARFKDLYLGGGAYIGGTGSANYLDDYEEGTWTPTYTTDGNGFGAITHDIQDGKYTKIGRTVTLTCRLRTSSVTYGSVSGALSVSGMPFTPASGSGLNLYWVGFNSTWNGAQAPNVVRISEGQTNMELYELPSAGGYSFNDALAGTDLATGSNANYTYFCLTYMST